MPSEQNMEYSHEDMNLQQIVPVGRSISPASPATLDTNGGCFAPMMQMNGRKVLSPPKDWVGPPPTSACELYVRRIPKELNEQKLIQPFLRFGRIYEIRLPMDFNQANRGYAYVKYTTEEDAACAMEVLSHYYVSPRRKLEILHSYEKCRLFVSNIPRELDESEIEAKFRGIFPSMQRLYTRGGVSLRAHDGPADMLPKQENGINIQDIFNGNSVELDMNTDADENGKIVEQSMQPMHAGGVSGGNRGHVFIHFPTHMHALEAKKSTTPGMIRLWGRDLKVVWANNEREADITKETKTLFVRNVDLSVNNRDIIDLLVQHVPRTTIRKISKVRTTAFFDFTTREAAEKCLQQLQGTVLRGQRLDLEWAKPSEQQSLHRMRNTDFDAVLRLKCIANGWQIPIVIFGTYFEQEGFQYGAVMLRDNNGLARAIFCILQPHELVDIHSRMCEVVCVLIETIGAFPDYNYVFFVQRDSAHLLGMITHNIQKADFIASYRVPQEFYFDFNELVDLSWAVAILASSNEETLLHAYQESFRTQTVCTYLQNWPVLSHRIFGTIMPKYRNKPPLKHNLNDTQIVLALCFTATGTNCTLPSRPYMPFPATYFDSGYEVLRYVTLKLLPIALTQSRYAVSHVLSHIQFGGSQYYHPAQRIMFPPMWITGCSYVVSIKQPQTSMLQQQQQHQVQQQQHQLQPPQQHQVQQQLQHPQQQLHYQQQPLYHSQSSPSSNGSAHSPVATITTGTFSIPTALALSAQNGGTLMTNTPLHILHT